MRQIEAVLKSNNQLADVLLDMVERLDDKNLKRLDFAGHLGVGDIVLHTYFRVILRAWYYHNVLKYISKQIPTEEFSIIRAEYIHQDYLFWGERIHDCYHQQRYLPLN